MPTAREPDDLVVYRLVEFDPPMMSDVQSHFELGKPKPRSVDWCRWRSVSVYTDIGDARKTGTFLKRRKGLPLLFIAQGMLGAKDGVVLHTPNNGDSHHDWWPCDQTDRLQAYVVVEQV